jgi:type I restriction enzyme S subunit
MQLASMIASDLRRVQRLRGELTEACRKAEGLRRSVLAQAFGGKLVLQDPDDEPASVLLERIAAERAAAEQATARRPRRRERIGAE